MVDIEQKRISKIFWLYLLSNLALLSFFFISGLYYFKSQEVTIDFTFAVFEFLRSVAYLIVFNLLLQYLIKIKKINLKNILIK